MHIIPLITTLVPPSPKLFDEERSFVVSDDDVPALSSAQFVAWSTLRPIDAEALVILWLDDGDNLLHRAVNGRRWASPLFVDDDVSVVAATIVDDDDRLTVQEIQYQFVIYPIWSEDDLPVLVDGNADDESIDLRRKWINRVVQPFVDEDSLSVSVVTAVSDDDPSEKFSQIVKWVGRIFTDDELIPLLSIDDDPFSTTGIQRASTSVRLPLVGDEQIARQLSDDDVWLAIQVSRVSTFIFQARSDEELPVFVAGNADDETRSVVPRWMNFTDAVLFASDEELLVSVSVVLEDDAPGNPVWTFAQVARQPSRVFTDDESTALLLIDDDVKLARHARSVAWIKLIAADDEPLVASVNVVDDDDLFIVGRGWVTRCLATPNFDDTDLLVTESFSGEVLLVDQRAMISKTGGQRGVVFTVDEQRGSVSRVGNR